MEKKKRLRIYTKKAQRKGNPSILTIYDSSDMGIGGKSGFDGAAIHFHDEKQKINEVYYVFRGTEPSKDFGDVVYDALGVGAGKQKQVKLEDAMAMYEEVEKNFSQIHP